VCNSIIIYELETLEKYKFCCLKQPGLKFKIIWTEKSSVDPVNLGMSPSSLIESESINNLFQDIKFATVLIMKLWNVCLGFQYRILRTDYRI
jgi:hypothetical protein